MLVPLNVDWEIVKNVTEKAQFQKDVFYSFTKIIDPRLILKNIY